MFYCIIMMFLLFLFGASRKTACRGYTCPSKFPLINIVKIICIILYYLWNFENKYSVCLSVTVSLSTKDSCNITVREGSEFGTLFSTLDSYEKPVGGDDSAGYFRSGD